MANLFTMPLGKLFPLVSVLADAGLTKEQAEEVCKNPALARKMVKALDASDGGSIIDLDADPFCPEGWKVENHQKGGQWKFDPSKVDIFLAAQQKHGSMVGNDLRKVLVDEPVLNANMLDWYLAHPDQIPEEWKGKYIFFWGTIYRISGGELFVRYLYWRGDRWDCRARWLGRDFDDQDPAAVHK